MKRKITYFFFVIVLSVCIFFPYFGNAKEEAIYKDILVKYIDEFEPATINVPKNVNFSEFLAYYQKNPSVEYAEPNYTYRAAIIPSDTYYNSQWYLAKIKAPQVWDIVRESPNVVIAIIDSGVQIDHPDLRDNIWQNKKEITGNGIDDDRNGFIDDVNGWDFVNNVSDPRPKFMSGFSASGVLHGTIVAGIAAASGNNAAGISGVSWRAQIMPLKVLDDKGEGDTNAVIKAIDYAIANDADIINFSFVGFGNSHALERAIRRAYNAGIIMVAAAGNEQEGGNGYFLDEKPMYPACHDGSILENMVIGVSATDALDQKASFSSYGSKCVDIAAPGVSIYSTAVYAPEKSIDNVFFNKYYDGYWSGTSMAAPMVSGAIALLETVGPGMSRAEITRNVIDNSDNINRLNQSYLWQLGRGRLNVSQAVASIKSRLAAKTGRILVVPFSGSATTSKISLLDKNGEAQSSFAAFGPAYRGGVNIASGDIDGDGVADIIAGAGSGGGPQVRIFDKNGFLKGQFFAYDKNFRGGVRIAAGKISGGARSDSVKIVTAPGAGGGPHIKIFSQKGEAIGQFFAYEKKFRGGVSLGAEDLDADGLAEIICGAGPGGTAHVRAFDGKGFLKYSFMAYEDAFSGGVNVGSLAL